MKPYFTTLLAFLLAFLFAPLFSLNAQSAVVKITPLGSHDGEFCRFDRALLLEDPNGTRLIYDVGRTVAGGEDPRLGAIDAVLLSHVHGDHLGDRRISQVNAGQCGQPDTKIKTIPNSNTIHIALAKRAKIFVGSEMNSFLAHKLKTLGGDPQSVQLVRFGASVNLNGVEITTVPAVHSNGLSGEFIDGELGDELQPSQG